MSRMPMIAAMLATLTAVSLGVPATAAEEDAPSRLTLGDATGDVWQLTDDEEPEEVDMPTADVVGAVAMHGRRRVEVSATFVDLQQMDPQQYSFELLTPSRRSWSFTVAARPGNWDGKFLSGGHDDSGEYPGCPVARHRVDYENDEVNVVIPRSCIGRPEWVRVMISSSLSHKPVEGERQHYWDDPHNSDLEGGGHTRRLFRAPEPGSTGTPAPFRVELSDPTGDVRTNGPGAVLAPDTPGADVVRATLVHHPRRFVIRQKFVELAAGDRQGYLAWLITDVGYRMMSLRVTPRHPDGVLRIERNSGRKVVCERARFAIDQETDVVVMSLPRSCLGRPGWVRAMLFNSVVRPATSESSAPSERRIFVDNPHNEQSFPARPTPRVYVGAGD